MEYFVKLCFSMRIGLHIILKQAPYNGNIMFLNKIIYFNQRFFNDDAIKYKPLIKYNVGWSVTTKIHIIYIVTHHDLYDLILNLLKWVKD